MIKSETLNHDEEINQELESLKRENVQLRESIEKLNTAYKKDIFNILQGFNIKTLMGDYINYANEISNHSQKRKSEFPSLKDNPTVKDFPLYMDHILFHFMKQDVMNFVTLLKYNILNNPINLETSYNKSSELAKGLTNYDTSLAWYINMKIPTTYLDTEEAIENQESIFKTLKEKTNVDARRIHLFYEEFKSNSNVEQREVLALFTTLLLEFLHGIESKVIVITDIEYLRSNVFAMPYIKGNKVVYPDDGKLVLLDGALYFSFRSLKNNNNHFDGETNVLLSDFIAEIPQIDKLKNPAYKRRRKNEYKKDKVYNFDNPIIYLFFKNYFLSLWNKDFYVNHLEKIIDMSNQCDKDLWTSLLDKEKDQLTQHIKDIEAIKEFYKHKIKVYDLLDFLKIYRNVIFENNNVINVKQFYDRYFGNSDNINGLDREFVKDMISRIIRTFPFNTNDKRSLWSNFHKLTQSFQVGEMNFIKDILKDKQ